VVKINFNSCLADMRLSGVHQNIYVTTSPWTLPWWQVWWRSVEDCYLWSVQFVSCDTTHSLTDAQANWF